MTRGVLIVAAMLFAIAARIGTAWAEDVQVNTYTVDHQTFPSVALDEDGDFVVVWQSVRSDGSDTSGSSVKGQRYDSNGSAVGSEFQINTYTTDNQAEVSVAMDGAGDFVIVWGSAGSYGTDTSGASVQGQLYASDGSAVGGQFQINTYTTDTQGGARVAMDEDGDFVVVWTSDGSYGTDRSNKSIQGQLFISDGSPIGSEFQVNTYTTDRQGGPSVAMDASSGFVVGWDSTGSYSNDASGSSIQGQRYASDGSPFGGHFQVNTYLTDHQRDVNVAMSEDGEFVIVWTSFGSDTDPSVTSVEGQLYASDGSPVGSQFQANTTTTFAQSYSSVAMAADGDFVVVWQSSLSAGTDRSESIQSQRYASDGSAVGGELQVNTYTTRSQLIPEVAMEANGEFVAVWFSDGSSGTDTDRSSVQRSAVRLIFADGFESGDLSAWQ